jgi:hypothetical protein
MTATPIDLRHQFGDRYRIEFDPAHTGRKNDPWMQIIPCKRGHIYPHGGGLLGVATNGRGSTATAIAKLPGVTVVQDGDDGLNATFPIELFPQIAKLVKPRRKRQLTPQQRQMAAARLANHRFSTARQSSSGPQESTLAV